MPKTNKEESSEKRRFKKYLKKLFLKQTKLKLEQNKIKAQTIIDYLPTYQKIFSVPNLSKNL